VRFEAEGWRVRKDGTEFWASVVIDPIHDEAGRLLGYAKVTRDVSDRRAQDEALAASPLSAYAVEAMVRDLVLCYAGLPETQADPAVRVLASALPPGEGPPH